MGSMSIWHWAIVIVVVAVLFGGRGKLSSIMGDAAKGIRAFREGLKEDPKADDPPAKTISAEREKDEARAAERKGQVGSGDRSERIRTYNFPQNRVTDHRINLTTHALERVLEGEIDQILDPLITHAQTEALKAVE